MTFVRSHAPHDTPPSPFTERAMTRQIYFVSYLLIGGLIAFVQAWPVMIALGILHSHWPSVPPFSYLECVALTWAWAVVWTVVGRELKFQDDAA